MVPTVSTGIYPLDAAFDPTSVRISLFDAGFDNLLVETFGDHTEFTELLDKSESIHVTPREDYVRYSSVRYHGLKGAAFSVDSYSTCSWQ